MDKKKKFEELKKKARQLMHEGNLPEQSENRLMDIEHLLDELAVYQIELEIQNEELEETQLKLQEKERAYFDLFENAPIAYLKLNKNGRIIAANTAAVQLLATEQKVLINQPFATFIKTDDVQGFVNLLNTVFIRQTTIQLRTHLQSLEKKRLIVNLQCNYQYDPYKQEGYCRLVIEDLTALETADEKARENAIRYDNFVQELPTAYTFTDETGTITQWNRAMEQLTGLPANRAIGFKIWQVHLKLLNVEPQNESVKGQIRSNYEQYFGKGDCIFPDKIHKTEIKAQLGQIKQIELQYDCQKTERGFCLNVSAKDISELESMHRELVKSEARYNAMFEHLNAGFAIYKPVNNGTDFVFVDINTAAERITNTHNKELIGASLLQRFPNMTKTTLVETLRRVNQTGKPEQIPAFFYQDKQRSGWRENFVYKLPSSELVAIFYDVSIREQAKKDLILAKQRAEESNDYVLSILKALPDILFIFDKNGLIVDYSANDKAILYRPPTEFLGKNVGDILPHNLVNLTIDKIQKVLSGSDIEVYSYTIELSGEERHFDARMVPMGADKCLSIVRDMTERFGYEAQLKTAKEQAVESDRLKTAFLRNMSHEIRTPMNGIIGFAQLLQQLQLSDEKRNHYLDIIVNSSEQLISIVEDILKASTLETRQDKINTTRVDLNELLRNLYQKYANKFKDKQLNFIFDKPDAQIVMHTDYDKLHIILEKLLGNAFQYTFNGEIEMGCSVGENRIDFYVRDTGIGIGKENIPRVFDRFWQAEQTATREFGGMGLGLTIVKAYVEVLGGQIQLQSTPGSGTLVTFWLPYKEGVIPIKSRRANDKEINWTEITILVTEDEESNYLYFKEVLEYRGIKLLHAEDGNQAVDICRKYPVDLVLMDLKMPRCNGFDATRRIREFAPDLPIIAQTAYSNSKDNFRALEAGCNTFISKPIEQKHLFNIIEKLLQKR